MTKSILIKLGVEKLKRMVRNDESLEKFFK